MGRTPIRAARRDRLRRQPLRAPVHARGAADARRGRRRPTRRSTAICRLAGGFRMGPFELMDLIGIDVNFAVARSFCEQSFGEPRWRPAPDPGADGRRGPARPQDAAAASTTTRRGAAIGRADPEVRGRAADPRRRPSWSEVGRAAGAGDHEPDRRPDRQRGRLRARRRRRLRRGHRHRDAARLQLAARAARVGRAPRPRPRASASSTSCASSTATPTAPPPRCAAERPENRRTPRRPLTTVAQRPGQAAGYGNESDRKMPQGWR